MIVLDTHTWLWRCLEPRRLSSAAAAAIRRAANDGRLAISPISLWEVAMMLVRGRVIPHGTPEAWLGALVDRSEVTVKEITPSIAALATHFPDNFPADPRRQAHRRDRPDRGAASGQPRCARSRECGGRDHLVTPRPEINLVLYHGVLPPRALAAGRRRLPSDGA